MTEPNDRELDRYLTGGSPLSRRYRDASMEQTPPELDEAVLRYARAQAQRPRVSRWFVPLTAVATVVLAVGVGWQMREGGRIDEVPVVAATPPPNPLPQGEGEQRRKQVDSPPPAPPRAGVKEGDRGGVDAAQKPADDQPKAKAPAPLEERSFAAAKVAPVLSEEQKIGALIDYVRGLQGAVFIRNGEEHSAVDAAEHLKLKREKAGDRVRTAQDFIRLCASESSLSGEPYQIRFADGHVELSEDVLRRRLQEIETPSAAGR